MAKFRFRLATLLRLRGAVRDERRAQLAEAYLLDRQLVDRKSGLEQEIAATKQSSQKASAGPLDVDRLVQAHRYELILRTEVGVLENQRTVLAAEIEKRRQALVAAETEMRILEKLREKQHARHREQEAVAEMKGLDELASRRHQREEVS